MFGEWTSSELCHSFRTPQHLCGEKETPGNLKTPAGSTKTQNYFLVIRTAFTYRICSYAFKTLGGGFQKIRDVGYCHELNAESDKRVQLRSCKPSLKEIYGNIKQCHAVLLRKVFCIWKIQGLKQKSGAYINSICFCCLKLFSKYF